MAKYKVLIGSVLHNSLVVEKGNSFELSEKEALPLLNANVVEKVKEEPKPEKKVEEKPKEEAPKEEPKEEAEAVEPTADWTKKELVDYAEKNGVEGASVDWKKRKILRAIKNASEKGGEKE